jgi:hypothetical protein
LTNEIERTDPMADSQLSATFPPAHTAPHPMANPGYGKRCAPDQHPRTAADFAHLPPREAAIAAFIDRLTDGADISVKTLAKVLPYGQCALRTALNRIQAAGHLRRGREHLHALTDGLPVPVHHPAALARKRLTTKLPPEPIRTHRPLRILECGKCGKCGTPARAQLLRDGDCGPCRGEKPSPARRPATLTPAQVHAHMADVRAAATHPSERNHA